MQSNFWTGGQCELELFRLTQFFKQVDTNLSDLHAYEQIHVNTGPHIKFEGRPL